MDDAKKARSVRLLSIRTIATPLNVMVDVERGRKISPARSRRSASSVAADSTDFEAQVRLAELLDEHEELEAAVNELGRWRA